jgi:hypothetical protein
VGIEVTRLVAIGTDCIVSYEFNYHPITIRGVVFDERNLIEEEWVLVKVALYKRSGF